MAVTISDVARAIQAPKVAADKASEWSKYIVKWGDIYRQAPVEIRFDLASGTYGGNRKTLGMGKRVPEDWSGLCWTEKASVTAGEEDSPTAEFMQRHFGVKFAPRFGTLLESQSFARGTCALEVRIDGMTPGAATHPDAVLSVGTVPAECILALEWDDDEITEVAFINKTSRHIDVRIHGGDENMRTIEFRRYMLNSGQLGARVSDESLIESGIAPLIGIQGAPPLFAVIKPQIANNIDADSPYGISVYANAESQLDAVDDAWDSMQTEIRLTRMMVGVPETMLRKDEQNRVIPPQSDRKDLFFAMADATGEAKHGMWTYNPNIRIEQLAEALNIALTSLSTAVGLGEERYRYRGETVATATQIISENSEAFRNRAKHLLNITDALTRIGVAMLWCQRNIVGDTSIDPDAEVTVRTDDSIIEDDGAVQDRGMRKVAAGVMSLVRYLVECEGLSLEDAEAEAERIGSETVTTDLI